MVEIKFCGLTRAEDAAEAERLGASYQGVIFAGGPRNLTMDQAGVVLAASHRARRVGVFASADVHRVVVVAEALRLSVLQVQADAGTEEVERVREATGLEVWPVIRIAGSVLPANAEDIFSCADAVVLDTRVSGVLGGSGRTFDWTGVARSLEPFRGKARIVLAGGLNPDNVADAISTLSPDIVDVSSGVEASPGIKDHDRMRRFAFAVRGAAALSG